MNVRDELRTELTDPRRVREAFGLGANPGDRDGTHVRCPAHGGISLNVSRGRSGTVRAKCFGCGFKGDGFSLAALVYDLNVRTQFRDVQRAMAEAFSRWDVLDYLDGRSPGPRPPRPTVPMRPLRDAALDPEPTYPNPTEVEALLAQCTGVSPMGDVSALLVSRGIHPEDVDDFGLARALPTDARLPSWACYRGQPWTVTGHRLLFPVFDARGICRSVRAWNVTDARPKRLPPAGRKAKGLVLACPMGVAILAGANDGFAAPIRVVVTEGEPDFLTWATHASDANESPPVVFGVGSGFWTAEHGERIPSGATVILRTDADTAGDTYALEVAKSLEGRCRVLRPKVAA